MGKSGFWRVLRRRVMPALVSLAAIAVIAASIVVIADTTRDGGSQRDADTATLTLDLNAGATTDVETREDASDADLDLADRDDDALAHDGDDFDFDLDFDSLDDLDGTAIRFFIANLLETISDEDLRGFLADLDIGIDFGPFGGGDGPVLGVRAADTPDGVVVRAVTAGSPADDAGIEIGSLIEAIDGQPVATVEALREALDEVVPGDKYALDVRVDGDVESVAVRRADDGTGGLAGLIERLLEWLTEELRG